MPAKDLQVGNLGSNVGAGAEMKKIERFLRLLTWQFFFLIAILLYLALRPQAGRYQFTVVGDDVGVFDTSNSQAWMIKLQKKSVTSGEQPAGSAAPTGEAPPIDTNQ
ncbi:MAG: hypothetical protein AB7P69_21785 [Candidatus Binatia bacterium]